MKVVTRTREEMMMMTGMTRTKRKSEKNGKGEMIRNGGIEISNGKAAGIGAGAGKAGTSRN